MVCRLISLCRLKYSVMLLIMLIVFIVSGRLKLCYIVRLYLGMVVLRIEVVVVCSIGVMVSVGVMFIVI